MMTSPLRILAVAGLPALMLAGCPSAYLKLAPPSPSEPSIPQPAGHDERPGAPPESVAQGDARVPIEESEKVQASRRYALADLVELAAASNPETRIVWQRARQAALAVGVANASYFPTLSAVALGGYQHSFFPLSSLSSGITVGAPEFLPGVTVPAPQSGGKNGHIGVDTFELLPFLAVRWQLLDWGRGAAVKAAEQTSVAANLVFVGEHQKLLFQVATAFFRLSAARAQVKVAGDALDRTRVIAQSAEARFGRGIATTVELAEARRELAQAEYDLTQAQAGEKTAYTALLTALGVDPRLPLEIETIASSELGGVLRDPVESYVQTALSSRPDLQASQAQLSRAQAMVDQAVATYVPKVSVVGTGGMQTLGAKISGMSFQTVTIPNLTAFASIEWLLFDGGARENAVEIARARREEAELQIRKLRNGAAQEVLSAYDEANAALSRYRAAQALEQTASVADEARAKSYAHGLSTLAEAANAQKSHALASAAKEQAYAAARIAATALTLAAGQLRSVDSIPNPTIHLP
jgi:outer membrane protein TolC